MAILGIGGVFIRSPDPKALSDWYARVLGFEMSKWGGATFAPQTRGKSVWTPFAEDTTHFAPSTREVMVNFVVEDLDGLIARIEAEGVELIGQEDGNTFGRFAWVMDPDGTKVELWEPKA